MAPLILDSTTAWAHAYRAMEAHEACHMHRQNIINHSSRANTDSRVDSQITQQTAQQENYWLEVLKRCVSVIRFLVERGNAFRGSNETVGSPHNGNVLGIMELLAEYDTFLAAHIQQHANRGRGHTNNLSSTTCEELIHLLGTHVIKEIVSHIRKAKYFSFTVDSTPDNSNVDQLTLVVRYMEDKYLVERFLSFMRNVGTLEKTKRQLILEHLGRIGVNIDDCRGQWYDNASNMSGRYNGMQAHIRNVNDLAVFVPYTAHSLNLVGQAAVRCCRADFVQQLYVFFTASIQVAM